jgi:hypothetical protein
MYAGNIGCGCLSWHFPVWRRALCVLLLNFLFRSRGLWSLFVLGGVACMWMTLGLALYKERNIPKTMVWEVFLIAVLCVLWDYFTGWRGWSINYVLPIVSMGVMVVLVFTCRLFHVAAGSLIVYLMGRCTNGRGTAGAAFDRLHYGTAAQSFVCWGQRGHACGHADFSR